MPGTIDQLIINGPYDEPVSHWRYERESRTFSQESGRRPAGYVVATSGSKSFDDPGHRHHQRLARTGRHLGPEPRKGPAIARHVEALALAWGVSKLPFVPDIIRAASHH